MRMKYLSLCKVFRTRLKYLEERIIRGNMLAVHLQEYDPKVPLNLSSIYSVHLQLYLFQHVILDIRRVLIY